ncbi:MAG: sigma-54-dependent Fis family transcriptional regulator [Candidatus Magnetomorum sp.]|nr:sigma-54-dependent Fis family transcriptional regulator [Candidatus Magnetomorum sp.]
MSKDLYPSLPIYIIDDDPVSREAHQVILEHRGMNHLMFSDNTDDVFSKLDNQNVSVILLDLMFPDCEKNGEDLLPELLQRYPEVPVIIITENGEIETAVKCMKSNAYDYLVKPVDADRLVTTVELALEYRDISSENITLQKQLLSGQLQHPAAFSGIVSSNNEMLSIFRYVEAVSTSTQPMLISGETGVGKELIANAVHKCSNRTGEFISISAAGMDDVSFCDKLFGHVKGAFDGADDDQSGTAFKASEGTIFLDEIADLSFETQKKLLHFIQEREYYPLGSKKVKRTSAKVIAATNQDLKNMVDQGKYRADLYYRLSTHHISIPPLRERMEDLQLLLDYFIDMSAKDMNKRFRVPSKKILSCLSEYEFPGNVRELRAMIYDAVVSQKRGDWLDTKFFEKYVKENQPNGVQIRKFQSSDSAAFISALHRLPLMRTLQDTLIDEALKRSSGNQTIAANMIGVCRQTIIRFLKR